jgi:hypothetical protein
MAAALMAVHHNKRARQDVYECVAKIEEKLPVEDDTLKSGHLSRQIISAVGATYLSRAIILSPETIFFAKPGADEVVDQIPLVEGWCLVCLWRRVIVRAADALAEQNSQRRARCPRQTQGNSGRR